MVTCLNDNRLSQKATGPYVHANTFMRVYTARRMINGPHKCPPVFRYRSVSHPITYHYFAISSSTHPVPSVFLLLHVGQAARVTMNDARRCTRWMMSQSASPVRAIDRSRRIPALLITCPNTHTHTHTESTVNDFPKLYVCSSQSKFSRSGPYSRTNP